MFISTIKVKAGFYGTDFTIRLFIQLRIPFLSKFVGFTL